MRGSFGFRKVAVVITELAKAFLQMERARIIDLGANPGRGEVRAERVALRGPDDELIVDVVVIDPASGMRFKWESQLPIQTGLGEFPPIKGGALAALCTPAIEMRKLDVKNRGLNG